MAALVKSFNSALGAAKTVVENEYIEPQTL